MLMYVGVYVCIYIENGVYASYVSVLVCGACWCVIMYKLMYTCEYIAYISMTIAHGCRYSTMCSS